MKGLSASEKAIAAANARFYAKRVNLGLCTMCGNPSRPGKVRCQACADAKTERDRARRNAGKQRRYDARRAAGVCTSCGKPGAGGAVCEACTERKLGAPKAGGSAPKHCGNCGRDGHGAATCRAPVFARCRCGLRLFTEDEKTTGSCGSCVPTAVEMATNRLEWP